jgi:hypothetical protein
MKSVAIASALVLACLSEVGCGSSTPPVVTDTTPAAAPKVNKPNGGGSVSIKGSDLKTASSDPGFGGKAH